MSIVYLDAQVSNNIERPQIKSIYEIRYSVNLINDTTIIVDQPSSKHYKEFYRNGKLAESNIFYTDDGEERRFKYYYDSTKLVKKESFKYDSTLYRRYFYSYNENVNLINISVYNISDSLLEVTRFYNDMSGRPLKEVKLDASGDTLFIFNSKYDTLGNLIEKTFNNKRYDYNRMELYKYDKNANNIEKSWYSFGNKLEYSWEYEYDSLNRLIKERDYPRGDIFDTSTYFNQTEYNYDKFNNVIKKTISRPGNKSCVITNFNYKYDNNFNWIVMEEHKSSFQDIICIVKREIKYFD
jgi:hypothetical protein